MFHGSGLAAIEEKKATGTDPTHGSTASFRRAERNITRKREAREWDETHGKLVDLSAFEEGSLRRVFLLPNSSPSKGLELLTAKPALQARGSQRIILGMRNGRFVTVTGAFAAAALTLAVTVGSATAGRTSHRSIVGTYRSVVRVTTGPQKGTSTVSTIRITKLDPKTGAFSGTGRTRPPPGQFVTITGTVSGRNVRLVAENAAIGYWANHRGSIKSDGTINGVFIGGGLRGRWTMTRVASAKPSNSSSTPRRGNSSSTTTLIISLGTALLVLVGLFFLAKWIVRKRQADGSGVTYEQMIAQQREKRRAAPAADPRPTPTEHQPPAPAAGTAATKTCPDCAETVLAAAKVCRFCRYRFDESSEPETPLSTN